MSTRQGAGCGDLDDGLFEVALGTADGRVRALVLAHVESCARCGTELAALNETVEALLALAPEREPGPGFESAVLRRMRRARPRVRLVPLDRRAVAAAALVALLVGFGAGALFATSSSRSGPERTALTGARGAPAALRGQVVVSDGWLFMSLDRLPLGTYVRCVVLTSEGRRELGRFWVGASDEAWSVALPAGAGVTVAELTTDSGRVLASGRLAPA